MESLDDDLTVEIENSSGSDMISGLSGEIINNILICLPIHEAAKTSILSKQWRFRWRYLSELVFDFYFFYRLTPPMIQLSSDKVFVNIYRVLLFHRGPISKFALSVNSFTKRYREMNQLMLYLSEKDIQEIIWEVDEVRVPSFLFSCVTLRRLTLSKCTFTVSSAFRGFVNLISLKFEQVEFENNAFETFIPKCPLLETLSIKKCYNIDNLDVDNLYLKVFHFYGPFKSICFRNTSHHLSAVIFDSETSHGKISRPGISDQTKLFECLPAIEHLRLGYHFMQFLLRGAMPRKLSATLCCLTVLQFSCICFQLTAEVSVVLCLIMSCPNLQKLEIMSVAADNAIKPISTNLLEVDQDLSDNALKMLRVVKMKLSDKKEVRPELEFIKFLLAESVVLEKMFIQPAYGTYAEEGFQILKEMIQFERSSKKAKIVFLEHRLSFVNSGF